MAGTVGISGVSALIFYTDITVTIHRPFRDQKCSRTNLNVSTIERLIPKDAVGQMWANKDSAEGPGNSKASPSTLPPSQCVLPMFSRVRCNPDPSKETGTNTICRRSSQSSSIFSSLELQRLSILVSEPALATPSGKMSTQGQKWPKSLSVRTCVVNTRLLSAGLQQALAACWCLRSDEVLL